MRGKATGTRHKASGSPPMPLKRCVLCGMGRAIELFDDTEAFFCSVDCAAKYALDNAPSLHEWCPSCCKWSAPDDWKWNDDACPECDWRQSSEETEGPRLSKETEAHQ